MSDAERLGRRLEGSIAAVTALRGRLGEIERVCAAVAGVLGAGSRLLTAGNGGSAAQALHLAEELVGRYRDSRPPLPAVCLNADPTALTCIANDFGFEQVFARQCEALLGRGDGLLVLSTSGRSPNLVAALEVARQRGAKTIGLLGFGGGPCAALCDECLLAPGDDSAQVQEAHQVVLHLICETLECVRTPGS